MRSLLSILSAIVGFVCAGGCMHALPRTAPPVVPIRIDGAAGQASGHGQGVLVGSRLLTALHVLTGLHERPIAPRWMRVGGAHTRASLHASGDLGVVESLYRPSVRTPLIGVGQDWAALELDSLCPVGDVVSFGIAPTAWTPGECVYAVRADFEGGVIRHRYHALFVLDCSFNEPVPEGLTMLGDPTGVDLSGWSGCFVGRYHADSGHWDMLGIYACRTDEDGRALHGVLRPPEAALAWLMLGAAER